MLSHALRIAAGLSFLFVVAVTFYPNLGNHVSSAGVVNAPIVTVSMPFEGRILAPSPPRGAPVPDGAPIFRAEATLPGSQMTQDRIAEVSDLAGQTAAVEAQIDRLETLRKALEARLTDHRAQADRWISARMAEARAVRARAVAQTEAADADAARIATLAARGAATARRQEQERAEARIARSDVARAEARIEALEIARGALARDIPLGDTVPALDYPRRRLDEIDLRLSAARAEADKLAARHTAAEARLAAARDVARRDETFAPRGAPGHVVWRPSPGAGARAGADEAVVELLDCSRRVVETALPERLFEALDGSRRVEMRLKGAPAWRSARVSAVVGSGLDAGTDGMAARLTDAGKGHLRALIEMPEIDLSRPGAARSFCDVGRSVQVRLPRRGILDGRGADFAARASTRIGEGLVLALSRLADIGGDGARDSSAHAQGGPVGPE